MRRLDAHTFEGEVFPTHFSLTDSSRFVTLPLEVAVAWEHKLGKPLTEVFVRMAEALTITPSAPKGFHLVRRMRRKQNSPFRFRVTLPVDWLAYHERNGRKLERLRLEWHGSILRVSPIWKERRATTMSEMQERLSDVYRSQDRNGEV